MTTKKLDRRIRRTRSMLREALIALMLEKGYENLTIQDITDRADLRRATFYLHYKDKDELLMTTLTETFDALVEQLEPVMQGDAIAGKTNRETYKIMFQHIADNADLYRIILAGSGTAAIVRNIRDYLAGHVAHALKALPDSDITLPVEVIAYYIAGTELALMTWWLENNQPHPPDEMARMTQQLVLNGARGVLSVNVIPQG